MVSAEILDVKVDTTNGSIVVKTQYKIDGVEVQSNYPLLNGKYYWQTRYNISQFAGMTDLEAKNRIFKDIKDFMESLTVKKYLQINNSDYVQQKASLLIGQTGSIQTADILVDTNGDNVVDTVWHVKTDGTKTEEPYTP